MSPSQLVHLHPGEIWVSKEPAIVSTILGSCISVGLFSLKTTAGGIIHFALPSDGNKEGRQTQPGKGGPGPWHYGDAALLCLISELVRLSGCRPSDFKAKVVGGAQGMENLHSTFAVGRQNFELAKRLLRAKGIPIVGQDVGGRLGRKVFFYLPSGRLRVSKLGEKGPSPSAALKPQPPPDGLKGFHW